MTVIIHRLCAIHKAPGPAAGRTGAAAAKCHDLWMSLPSILFSLPFRRRRQSESELGGGGGGGGGPVERFERHSSVNNNRLGVVYNLITTARWHKETKGDDQYWAFYRLCVSKVSFCVCFPAGSETE